MPIYTELAEPTPSGLFSIGYTVTNATMTQSVSSTSTTRVSDRESSSNPGDRNTMTASPVATYTTAGKPSSFDDTTGFPTPSAIATSVHIMETEIATLSVTPSSASVTLTPITRTVFTDHFSTSSSSLNPSTVATMTVVPTATPIHASSSMTSSDSTHVITHSVTSMPAPASTISTAPVAGSSSTVLPNPEPISTPVSSSVSLSPSMPPTAEGGSDNSAYRLPLIIGSVVSIAVLGVTNIMQLILW